MSSYEEIGEAIARNLEGHGFEAVVHTAETVEPPRVTVYDGDGNVVFERKVLLGSSYDGPKRTFKLEHSSDEDGWTDLSLSD